MFFFYKKDKTISPTDIQADGSVPIDYLLLLDNNDGSNGVILDGFIGSAGVSRTITFDLEASPSDGQAFVYSVALGRWRPLTVAASGHNHGTGADSEIAIFDGSDRIEGSPVQINSSGDILPVGAAIGTAAVGSLARPFGYARFSGNINVNGETITDTTISNWDDAYSWGDHAGLYALVSHNHDSDYYQLDGSAALAGNLWMHLDGVYDYGTNDGGTTLRRPRDVRLSRYLTVGENESSGWEMRLGDSSVGAKILSWGPSYAGLQFDGRGSQDIYWSFQNNGAAATAENFLEIYESGGGSVIQIGWNGSRLSVHTNGPAIYFNNNVTFEDDVTVEDNLIVGINLEVAGQIRNKASDDLELRGNWSNPTGAIKLIGQSHNSSVGASVSGTAHTIDWTSGNNQHLNLNTATGDVTLTLSNPRDGAEYVIHVTQDTTTHHDFIWPGNVKIAGGSIPHLTESDGAVDIIRLYYDGTNYNILAFEQNLS